MESRIKRYDHETWHHFRDCLKCTEDWKIIDEDFQGVTVKKPVRYYLGEEVAGGFMWFMDYKEEELMELLGSLILKREIREGTPEFETEPWEHRVVQLWITVKLADKEKVNDIQLKLTGNMPLWEDWERSPVYCISFN